MDAGARQPRRRPHGADDCHDPGRLCRRIPDLLYEGSVRWRILHRRHSAVVDCDGPRHRWRPACALVHRDGSVRAALLEARDVVEAGPCAAITRSRDRHLRRLSLVPLPRPPRHRDHDGAITPIFVGLWLVAGAEVTTRPRSTRKAITAGLTSGITTMVAHSGGPPLAMYLLPLGLSKEIYAGTTSLFFTVGNATKAVPWLLLVRPTAGVWELMAICLLAIPAGVWLGWRLHGALDQRQIYRACYGLLVVTALKLLWDGVSGYL